MRFSISWLLAATAYAAVVCASVVYAGESWRNWVAVLTYLVSALAVAGSIIFSGARRAWFIGFASVGLLFQASMVAFSEKEPTEIRRAMDAIADGLAKRLPFDDQEKRALKNLKAARPNHTVVEMETMRRLPEDNYHVAVNWIRPDGTRLLSTHLVPISVLGDSPPRESRKVILRDHLILVFSLFGGLLGLWFWKREEKARSATTGQAA